jgi:iron-sulfur cluster assembly protein
MTGTDQKSMAHIHVTPAATAYLSGLTADAGKKGVRLAIKGGKGCGGNEYDVDFADAPAPGEETIALTETLSIFIPMMDTFRLFGATIDYRKDDLGNTRMIIDNPNEKGRCGCGESVVF